MNIIYVNRDKKANAVITGAGRVLALTSRNCRKSKNKAKAISSSADSKVQHSGNPSSEYGPLGLTRCSFIMSWPMAITGRERNCADVRYLSSHYGCQCPLHTPDETLTYKHDPNVEQL